MKTDSDSPVSPTLPVPVPVPPAGKAGGAASDERLVRLRFWPKLRANLGRLPFVDDLLAAWFCAIDPATPSRVKIVLFGALAYFVLPFDTVPDFVAVLGFTDDAAVLLAAVQAVRSHLRPDHYERARAALAPGGAASASGKAS